MTIQLSRAQHRQMKKLADRVDRVAQADRLFFERFPARKHRVRLASIAEIEQHELIKGAILYVDSGCRIFAAIRNVAPGFRLKQMFRGIEGAETDLAEEMAAAIFERSATPRSRLIEAQMLAAAGAR